MAKKNKAVVFFDFNGVLDVEESYKIFDRHLMWELMKKADLDKVYRLLRFIYDNKLCWCSISGHDASGGAVFEVLMNVMSRSDVPEHQEIGRIFYDDDYGIENYVFPKNENNEYLYKEDLVKHVMKNNEFDTCVVFEDEYIMKDKFNFIKIDPKTGLTEEHIKKAQSFIDAV